MTPHAHLINVRRSAIAASPRGFAASSFTKNNYAAGKSAPLDAALFVRAHNPAVASSFYAWLEKWHEPKFKKKRVRAAEQRGSGHLPNANQRLRAQTSTLTMPFHTPWLIRFIIAVNCFMGPHS